MLSEKKWVSEFEKFDNSVVILAQKDKVIFETADEIKNIWRKKIEQECEFRLSMIAQQDAISAKKLKEQLEIEQTKISDEIFVRYGLTQD
jgi:hypothetical protein